ncbi:MAG: hydantoinase B/oxoprolinase family protein, partial [Terracidiphilus sp.]
VEVLGPAQLALFADRRRMGPWGLAGGAAGAAGAAWVIPADGGAPVELPGKCSRRLAAGDAVRIETPGGGGWGKAESE